MTEEDDRPSIDRRYALMNCPNCKTVTLVMSERQGVEIDHCPQCRGVWLDRGELDKILERSARFDDDDDDDRRRQSAPPPPPPAHYGSDYRRDDDYYKHKYHKRKSFWSELFD
jgi:Zn-finger nucleic acid-binding protein